MLAHCLALTHLRSVTGMIERSGTTLTTRTESWRLTMSMALRQARIRRRPRPLTHVDAQPRIFLSLPLLHVDFLLLYKRAFDAGEIFSRFLDQVS